MNKDQLGVGAGVVVQASRAALLAEIMAVTGALGVPVDRSQGGWTPAAVMVVDQRDVAGLAGAPRAATNSVLVVGLGGEEAGIIAACRALGTPHGFELPAGADWLGDALLDLCGPTGATDPGPGAGGWEVSDPTELGSPAGPLGDWAEGEWPLLAGELPRALGSPTAPGFATAAGVGQPADPDPGTEVQGSLALVDRDRPVGQREPGLRVGVIPACGGAGASTLTIALALAGAEFGDTLAVSADPWTCGLEVGLGLSPSPASGWSVIDPDAQQLDPLSLRDGLPRHPGFWVLVGASQSPGDLPEALHAVIAAGRAGFDLTIVDFGRTCAGIAAADECDVVVIVLPATLAGVLGARRIWEQLGAGGRGEGPQVVLACRNEGPLSPAAITDYLGQDVALSFGHSRLLQERWDAGEAIHGRCGRKLAGWGRELLANLPSAQELR